MSVAGADRAGPRTPEHIESLGCRLARESLWGYQRLRGELLKLRVTLSTGCAADILHPHGLPPAPQRAGLTWQQFLSRHATVMPCGDLLTTEVWTLSGLRTAYVLSVLLLGTRRTVLAEATFPPNGLWMAKRARNLLMAREDSGVAPRFVAHDRDKLLIWDLDALVTGAQARVVETPFRAPDANAERWVCSVTEVCLDHPILCGLGSLQRVPRVYVSFFSRHRPHQGIGNQIASRNRDISECRDTTREAARAPWTPDEFSDRTPFQVLSSGGSAEIPRSPPRGWRRDVRPASWGSDRSMRPRHALARTRIPIPGAAVPAPTRRRGVALGAIAARGLSPGST